MTAAGQEGRVLLRHLSITDTQSTDLQSDGLPLCRPVTKGRLSCLSKKGEWDRDPGLWSCQEQPLQSACILFPQLMTLYLVQATNRFMSPTPTHTPKSDSHHVAFCSIHVEHPPNRIGTTNVMMSSKPLFESAFNDEFFNGESKSKWITEEVRICLV